MATFGIDVSRWQGKFDFVKAKQEGVKFVILRAGGADDGLYTDYMFVANYNAARAAGLAVGVYYYFDAYNTDQARTQVSHFLSIIRGKKFEYPAFADVEADMADQPKAALDPIMRTILSGIETGGYWAGWYAGLATYYWHVDGPALAARYSWWLPYWGSSKPKLDGIQMWQFGGSTNYIRTNKVAGVVCDQDYAYVDYPTLIKQRGKNGYPKTATPTPAPAPKPAPTPAKTLKPGAKIKLKANATVYGTKKKFAAYVYANTYVVQAITGAKNDRVAFGPTEKGANTGAVAKGQITLV